MEQRLTELEDAYFELSGQVGDLRGEVRRLRRLIGPAGPRGTSEGEASESRVSRLGSLVGGLLGGGGRDSRAPSAYPSPSVLEEQDLRGEERELPEDSAALEDSFSLAGQEFNETASRSRSGAGTTGRRTPSSASSTCSLSWEEREAICEEIAAWVRRSLRDNHRGPSGRDRVSLASRVWLVFRDIDGDVKNPVVVCRTFAACKRLVKREDSVGNSIFVGLPSDREAKRVVSFAGLDWPDNQ